MAMLQNDWVEAVGEEFKKPYYAELYKFVKEEEGTTTHEETEEAEDE